MEEVAWKTDTQSPKRRAERAVTGAGEPVLKEPPGIRRDKRFACS